MLPILFHAALGYLSSSILFARVAAALLHRQDQLLLACCICGQLLPLVIAALHLLICLKKENIL